MNTKEAELEASRPRSSVCVMPDRLRGHRCGFRTNSAYKTFRSDQRFLIAIDSPRVLDAGFVMKVVGPMIEPLDHQRQPSFEVVEAKLRLGLLSRTAQSELFIHRYDSRTTSRKVARFSMRWSHEAGRYARKVQVRGGVGAYLAVTRLVPTHSQKCRQPGSSSCS